MNLVRARRLLAVVVALLVVAGEPQAQADGDYTVPTLVSFTRTSPGVVGPGATVSMDYVAFDDMGPVVSASFTFTGPAGDLELTTKAGATNANGGTATGVVPTTEVTGVYKLDKVRVADGRGNYATYGSYGWVDKSPLGAVGPTQHDIDFGPASFTLANLQGDLTAPLITSLHRTSSDTAAPGDTVTVAFGAADLGSGVAYGCFEFTNPVGDTRSACFGSPDPTAPASFKVYPYDAAGPYRLDYIYVTDKAHNITWYRRDGTASAYPVGVIGPLVHLLDFAQLDFTVENPNEDIDVPVLESVGDATPESVGPGDVVTMPYVASDPTSGYSRASAGWEGPFGHMLWSSGGYGPTQELSVTVPASAPSGRYRLRQVDVYDRAGNRLWYFGTSPYYAGRTEKIPPGLSGSIDYRIDLTPGDFTVDNGPVPTTTTTTTRPPTTTTSPTTTSTTSTTVAPSTTTSTTTTTVSPTTTTSTSTTTTTRPFVPNEGSDTELTFGPGAGGGPHVRSYAVNGVPLSDGFGAWRASFTGGVPVARGDLDGQYGDEIVAGSGPGGSAFAVFGALGGLRFARTPFGTAYRGGVTVAVGDVAGDATPEIVVATASGAGRVQVYDAQGAPLGAGFAPYGSGFTGGINLAVGHVESWAHKARIITAPAGGMGPDVKLFTAAATLRRGFTAYATSFTGGVFVASGDLDADGTDEIFTAPGSGGGPHLRAFAFDGAERLGFMAYPNTMTGGVRVAVGDLTGDGKVEVVTVPGPGWPSQARIFSRTGKALPSYRFTAYDPSFLGGAYVAVGRS